MRRCPNLLVVVFCMIATAWGQTTSRILAEEATLRGTPEANGLPVASVTKDEPCEVMAKRGDWSLVQTARHVGWIESVAVSLSGRGSGSGPGVGSGSGIGWSDGMGVPPGVSTSGTQGLRLLSVPRPGQTEVSLENGTTGTVQLRVTFLANGTIGSIAVVKGLPDGLTEQAIHAARKIKFEPAKRDGKPQTVTKLIEYTFTPY